MEQSESGQDREGYGFLLGFLGLLGLIIGVLYMLLFQRPFREFFYILPLAVLGTIFIFALFILIIHFLERP